MEAVSGDVYALGVTLHRLLCGDAASMAPLQPDVALDQLVRAETFLDRSLPGPHVHKSICRVLVRALHVDVTKRFATASELRHALEAAMPVVSWGPSAQRVDGWEGEAMDGRSSWWAEVGQNNTGEWQLCMRRQLEGGRPRSYKAMDAEAASRAALQPLLVERLVSRNGDPSAIDLPIGRSCLGFTSLRDSLMARMFSGRRLREVRVAAGVPTERLALDLGRSSYSIHEYERGRVLPPVNVLSQAACSWVEP